MVEEPMNDLLLNRNYNILSAGAFHIAVLKPDGTVVAVGQNHSGECDVSSWTDIMDIRCGAFYTLGLKYDGTVVCAGLNGKATEAIGKWKHLIAISAGAYRIAGLKYDGTVVQYGFTSQQNRDTIASWKDITAISAGSYHLVGLKKDGTLVYAGAGEDAGLNTNLFKDVKNVTAIDSGKQFTVYLRDGKAYAEDYAYKGGSALEFVVDHYPKLYEPLFEDTCSDIAILKAGCGNLLGIALDGHIMITGEDRNELKNGVSQWENMIDIDAGLEFVVGINKDGKILLTGKNILRNTSHPFHKLCRGTLFDSPDEYETFRIRRLKTELDSVKMKFMNYEDTLHRSPANLVSRKNRKELTERYEFLQEEQKRLELLTK